MENFLWITKNYRSAQSKFVPEVFTSFIKDFDLIVEIGTFTGAFTEWMSLNMNDNCKLVSYDINESYREIKSCRNTEFKIANCFEIETILEISNLIKNHNRVLFLCDGGDKETELKIFSRYLKPNDVIMLHDYAHTDEDYERIKSKIDWPTPYESHFKNIERYLPDLRLKPHLYENLKSVLWGSFIKF